MNFSNADLFGAKFEGAKLWSAKFKNCLVFLGGLPTVPKGFVVEVGEKREGGGFYIEIKKG